jgi:hypothetical protein
MSAYPPKMAAESDKEYLRRVLPAMTAPICLPESFADYFECSQARVVPVLALHSTKTVEENERSSVNAAKAMTLAAAGLVSKRAPLRVRPRSDGDYDIVDGNATYTACSRFGWASLPVIILESPTTVSR